VKGNPGHPPAYRPADYVRGYSREQIVEHVSECLSIFAELDNEEPTGIPLAIAPAVFSVVQIMVAAVEPSPEKIAAMQAAAKLAGMDGAALVGRG
jgi:hypothetical protein